MVDNTRYPDKPTGATWYLVTVFVDLLVVVEDPDDEEGVINFIVLSDQIFTVKPDTEDAGLWVIYKQEDQERPQDQQEDLLQLHPAHVQSSLPFHLQHPILPRVLDLQLQELLHDDHALPAFVFPSLREYLQAD